MNTYSAVELSRMYQARFAGNPAYRREVWNVLVSHFFQRYVRAEDTVLDLGCGYGEFINAVRCKTKFAMDLNPDAQKHLSPEVQLIEHDCSRRWPFDDEVMNVVFTSNFFEHLPDKATLGRILDEIFRCLRPGGRLIAMGPNVKYLPGEYWDFWDHHLPLTEMSLAEGLTNHGFETIECVAKFLPYTMVNRRGYPDIFLKLYLRLPLAWRILGKQFLLVATKPGHAG